MKRRSFSTVVVGTFTIDELQPWRGRVTSGKGGLYYSLMVLAGLVSETDRIYPVARVGRDLATSLRRTIRRFPAIKSDCLIFHNGCDNSVRSWYPAPGRRQEVSLHIPRPLGMREIAAVPDFDLAYVNLISGREMPSAVMNRLRERSSGAVYLDYHSMALAVRKSGMRYPIYKPCWTRWTAAADIVQLNLEEAALLNRGNVDTPRTLARFADKVFATGPRLLIITQGKRGALLFERRSRHRTPVLFPAHSISPREDIPGCGDAFGAGFVASYLRYQDPHAAVRCGNYAASRVAALNGSRKLAALAASASFDKERHWRVA